MSAIYYIGATSAQVLHDMDEQVLRERDQLKQQVLSLRQDLASTKIYAKGLTDEVESLRAEAIQTKFPTKPFRSSDAPIRLNSREKKVVDVNAKKMDRVTGNKGVHSVDSQTSIEIQPQ